MKYLVRLLALLFVFLISKSVGFAQLVKKWDNTFGTDKREFVIPLIETIDKGFLIGGSTMAGVNGDKTQPGWGWDDIWIVKTDSSGKKVWDKDFGGNQPEDLHSILETSNQDLLLIGSSKSGVSGNKSEPNWDTTTISYKISYDFWIIKTNKYGNKIWDKRFGGTNSDGPNAGINLPGNTYLIGGWSASDIGGNKSESNRDSSHSYLTDDYWIVKIDDSGNKIWDRTYGGTKNDVLTTMLHSDDGGIILGGWSNSNIGAEKSEDSRGGYDYWIIKIDSIGNKIWDKTFGGGMDDILENITQTLDGGFILTGYSFSGIGGEKSESNWDNTLITSDYWIVKIDGNGNKIWDKRYGGSSRDELFSFSPSTGTDDGNLLICGFSYSPSDGDKTQTNLPSGSRNFWIISINSLTHKKNWDQTIFVDPGYGHIRTTSDNNFIIWCATTTGIFGDKTQPGKGSEDYWMAKYKPITANISENTSSIFFDIYPNPTRENFTISYNLPIEIYSAHLRIYNSLGIEKLQCILYRNESQLTKDIKLVPGIYFFQIITEKGNSIVKKLIVAGE